MALLFRPLHGPQCLPSAHRTLPLQSPACLSPQRALSDWRDAIATSWEDEKEIEEARKFLASFKQEDIPRKCCDLAFSQASGPGGQNVNRSSTKATLHLDLARRAGFLPSFAVRKLREHCRHLTKDDKIVIQSDETRNQHENIDDCFHRLYNQIMACVRQDVPGETSPEKHKRVMELQKAERMQRMRMKNKQKEKKNNRRGRSGDID